jgi:PRTRC genetic system protein B
MKEISELLSDVYMPEKALVIFRHLKEGSNGVYVEAYDMDAAGKPVNAHPLSVEESAALAKALDSSEDLKKDFLTGRGLLPEQVLHINARQGFALWYTPPQETGLMFHASLSIPCGKAHIPAMIWKADRSSLDVFALKGMAKPKISSVLYHAPYFNMHSNGSVCMGTVKIDLEDCTCLEEFMNQWEQYFFGSYFSHVIADSITTGTNIVQLWQQQVGTGRPFPEDVLLTSTVTLKSLLQ